MKAHVNIQTAERNGITCLHQSYCTPPFKVANITEDKKAGPLHLMLMSSSPGILDEDDYQIKINIDEGCHLQLHTQSYQRLFNMKKGATQCMEVEVQKNASFVYIPHPTVPHEQASFTARNKIYLQHNSRLIWGEILTCGRKLNGEQFCFAKYHSITDIYHNNRLVIKENLLIQPALVNVHGIGQWEGHSHQASMIICDNAEAIHSANDSLYNYLQQQSDITFGISAVAQGALVIRILGYRAEQLFNCLLALAALLHVNHKESVGAGATYAP